MQIHSPPNLEVPYRQHVRRTTLTAARVLMALAAVGALAAVAASIQVVNDAGPATLVVEIWRCAGFVLFSGLFALLAYRPLHYAGVWELVIANKLALTAMALTYASDADGAGEVALVDGILTAVLLAAYLLSCGWRAWSCLAPHSPRAICTSAPSPSPATPGRDGQVSVGGGARRHSPP